MSSSNFIRSSGSSTAETNESNEFILELGLERKMCVKMEVNIVGIKRISSSLLKLSKLLTRPVANWVLSPWSHAWFDTGGRPKVPVYVITFSSPEAVILLVRTKD